MKRGRKSRVPTTTRKREKAAASEDDDQNSNFGLSITQLPRYISMDILLRLSVNILLVCRCACKTWRNLISDPEFAKLHFAKSEVYTLVRCLSSYTYVSRTLYLVEPPDNNFNFISGRRNCHCDENWPDFSCDKHFRRKLKTKLKIPLRNFDDTVANLNVQPEVGSKRKRCIKVRANDHRFNITNSCRGLLCLCEPFCDDPIAVCNPITGEFINLPALTQACKENRSDCALGFSPPANHYKVIRMFSVDSYDWTRTHDPITGEKMGVGRVVEIHTLGTSSWRRIGYSPRSFYSLRHPTYLNGAVHWLYFEEDKSEYVISFNFVDEKFKPIPAPPHMRGVHCSREDVSLGELSGRLCMCYPDSCIEELVVWVMKEYGVKKSWAKEYRLNIMTPELRWLRGLYKPVTILRDGGLLLFHYMSRALFYFYSDGKGFKSLKLCGFKSKYEAIAYIPSFISLKDVVAGDAVQVLNVSSRCAVYKLPGETKSLLLEESTPDWDSDFNLSSYGEDSDD